MTIIVSADVKPPAHPFYGDSWERGLDPFHPDAFEGLGDDIINQIRSMNPGTRKGGWFLVDTFGNDVGFVPDGTVLKPFAPTL